MAETSSIEWTDATWNPVTGCSVLSPGCTNCYAMREAGGRLQNHPSRAGLTNPSKAGPVWNGEVRLNEAWLTQPLAWKRPRRIFVCAHGDLFHEAVPDAWIDRVFAVMALAPRHAFQVLTKRAERMRDWFSKARVRSPAMREIIMALATELPGVEYASRRYYEVAKVASITWPLSNVWLGVSAEDQVRADERIPHLLATPAAVRFLSAEPLLGRVNLTLIRPPGPSRELNALTGHGYDQPPDHPRLDWVIAGGESGAHARSCWVPDVRNIVRQCARAGVAVYVKQLGANVQDRDDAGFDGCEPHEWPDVDPACVEESPNGCLDEGYQGAPVRIRLRSRKGGDPEEWPPDLRVRQFPDAREHNAMAEEG